MIPREQLLDDALARAVIWRFLALGFAPPADELHGALARGSGRDALDAALKRLELPRFRGEPRVALQDRYATLFGHTLRGKACPYETEYGRAQIFQQAQQLADLQGWYGAFGLARRPDRPERADHIGVECEFAGVLCRKEAYMLERGDEEQVRLVREAYRRFLRDHLGQFALAVSAHLERTDAAGFYGRVAALSRALLLAECRRLDVRPGPATLPLRAEGEDDAPAACGADCGPCADETGVPPDRAGQAELLQVGPGEIER